MTTIEKKQLEKRKIIGEKATNLMNEVGFENLTVRMICDAAGISAGTFYHYFQNKSELVTELFSLVDNYFEENVLNKLNHEDEVINIIVFCTSFAEYVSLCGIARSKLINSMFPPYSSRGIHEERKRILYSELYKIIERGQAKGQISKDYKTNKLVDMIIVMIRGYCFDWARREGIYDLVEYTEELIRLFVRALVPRENQADEQCL
jgi:AcrR family transcriptional regulator